MVRAYDVVCGGLHTLRRCCRRTPGTRPSQVSKRNKAKSNKINAEELCDPLLVEKKQFIIDTGADDNCTIVVGRLCDPSLEDAKAKAMAA